MKLTYSLSYGKTVKSTAQHLAAFLENEENMDTQTLCLENGTVIVQARVRGGMWRQWVGLDKCITVRLSQFQGGVLGVEIGDAKWIDKGLAIGVSFFLLFPLVFTAGFGWYQQSRLPESIQDCLYKYLLN